MSITFRCEHCGKDVKAPDGAGGKRGKCPYCGQSNYIPTPVSDDELLSLAPIDDEEERRRAREIRQLRQQESDLIAETGGSGDETPPEHRDDLKPEDVYHHVVNYCMDMANSNLERAELHVAELKKFGYTGRQAVDDFIGGKAIEPALDFIPRDLLKGILTQLNNSLK